MLEMLKKWLVWLRSTRVMTVQRIGLFVAALSVAVGILGYQGSHPEGFDVGGLTRDFYANVSAELASIAITVLIIDKLIELRDSEKELMRLKRLMTSRQNFVSTAAVGLMRARGWLFDGSLQGIDLRNANIAGAAMYDSDMSYALLSGADAQGVDLTRAILRGAVCNDANFDEAKLYNVALQDAELNRASFREAWLNGAKMENSRLVGADFDGARLYTCKFHNACLRGTRFRNAHLNGVEFNDADLSGANFYEVEYIRLSRLEKASKLRGAIMPDGTLYEGQFALKGDIQDAEQAGVDLDNPGEVARFYQGVC